MIDHHPNEFPYVCVRFSRVADGPCDMIDSLRLCFLGDNEISDSQVKHIPKDVFDSLDGDPADFDEMSAITPALIQRKDIEEDPTITEDPLGEEISAIIDGLPKEQLYDRSVTCEMCSYATKVRLNMVRHLQLHKTQPLLSSCTPDPVNTVKPTAKHLPSSPVKPTKSDQVRKRRMTICAPQSTPSDEMPEYVQKGQRYICGAGNCSYFTHEERMLRCHLESIHANDGKYVCPHCKFTLNGPAYSVESVLDHYRLHEEQLFKCVKCDFFDSTRHNVSKHIRKRHYTSVNEDDIVEIRNSWDSGTEGPAKKPKTIAQRRRSSVSCRKGLESCTYKCSYCTFTSEEQTVMDNHSSLQHGHNTQFQCQKCASQFISKPGFKRHIGRKHDGETVNLLIHYHILGDDSQPIEPIVSSNGKSGAAKSIPAENAVSVTIASNEKNNSITNTTTTTTAGTTKAAPMATKKVEKPITTVEEISRISTILCKSNMKKSPEMIQYHCEACPEKFPEWSLLQNHYEITHLLVKYNPKLPNFLSFGCFYCAFTTVNQSQLNHHHSIYHGSLMSLFRIVYLAKCVYCGLSSSTEKIVQHNEERHRGSPIAIKHIKNSTCALCDFKFVTENSLAAHFSSVHKKITSPKLMFNEKLMKRVMNVKINRRFQCGTCHKMLENREQYIAHPHQQACKAVEMRQKFLCTICPRLITNYGDAKKHMEAHQSNQVSCDRCKAEFLNLDVLMVHMSEHRNVAESMNALTKKYAINVVFPNGFVVSEADLTPAAIKEAPQKY